MGASLSTGKRGMIFFDERCLIENGTVVRACNGKISFGKKTYVNRNSMIFAFASISIGDYTTIGPNVCIYDHDHDRNKWNEFVAKPSSNWQSCLDWSKLCDFEGHKDWR